jgi:hypothetical protein
MVSLIERFKNKLANKNKNGCIKWLGWKNHDGYGKFSLGKVYKFAHRFAYELGIGTIPKGKYVLHKCDVRECCNIEHLYIGTQHENNKDSYERHRRNSTGVNNGHAILNEDNVRYIKSMFGKITCAQLARDFKVSESCIHDIKHGRSWRHI